jgi:hypothetical protein
MIGTQNNKMVQVPFEEAIKEKQKIDLELLRVADITSI